MLYGSSQVTGTALVSSATIRAHTRIGYDEMGMLLEKMVAAGWVGRVQDDLSARMRWGRGVRENADNWVLLTDPSKLRVADVYRLFVFDHSGADVVKRDEPQPDTPLAVDTAQLARQVENAVEQGLDQTLDAHFRLGTAESTS